MTASKDDNIQSGIGCMAFVALLVAVSALGWNVYRDWWRTSPLTSYDFSSPEASYRSKLQMELKKDWRAQMEYELKVGGPLIQEKLDSLKISKTVDWKDAKILFIAYQEKGTKRHITVAFEQDYKTNFWKRIPFAHSDLKDEKLVKEVRAWED